MTKQDLRTIREVIDHLEMTHCSFGNNHFHNEPPLPQCEDDVTPFIKARTERWRETWVLPQLRGLVAKYDKPKDGGK